MQSNINNYRLYKQWNSYNHSNKLRKTLLLALQHGNLFWKKIAGK